MSVRTSFFLLLFPVFSLAQIPPDSKPRHDLYKKIKKTTSVSLKEAYNAVFNHDKRARYELARYAKLKGTKGITKGFQLEIKNHKQKCNKEKNNLSCKQQVTDLVKQRDFIGGLDKEVGKNPKLGLYRSLVVMSYVIRHEILKPSYKKWSKECSNQKKINTLKCKKQFFETDILYSIVKDLTQASYSSATKTTLPINKSELKKMVARYE